MIDFGSLITNPAVTHTSAVAGGFGLSWLLSFIKHAPAPRQSSLWLGAIFDATQDTAKNSERVGQRRTDPNQPPLLTGQTTQETK